MLLLLLELSSGGLVTVTLFSMVGDERCVDFCICVCCFLLSFLYTPLFLFVHLPVRSAFASLSTFFHTLVGVVRYFVQFGIPEGRGFFKGKRGKGRKERKMDVDYESSGGDAIKESSRMG